MVRYYVDYENWSQEQLKELGVLLNGIMTRVSNSFANDDEEASWLRQFESNLDKLINKRESKE